MNPSRPAALDRLRVCIVSPRYGTDVVGGAETLLRLWAEQLARRGHHVEVLTTCASNHHLWINDLPEGDSNVNGISVRRLPISVTPDLELVARLHAGIDRLPPDFQEQLLHNKGFSQPLLDTLDSIADSFDALVFGPYLFPTTVYGARVRPAKSLVLPALHDEAYARFEAVDLTLSSVAGLLPSTESEEELARARLTTTPPCRIIGAGFETTSVKAEQFRTRHDIHGDVIAYAGRREAGKNFPLLMEWVTAYNSGLSDMDRAPLLVMGSGEYVFPPSAAGCYVDLGFVAQQHKLDAMAASVAVANLSVNESFSLVAMEAWLAGTPVIVHRDGTVLRRHCELSGGGLWVRSAEEFAEALDRLRRDASLRTTLATQGNAYVTTTYSWPAVIERLEDALRTLPS